MTTSLPAAISRGLRKGHGHGGGKFDRSAFEIVDTLKDATRWRSLPCTATVSASSQPAWPSMLRSRICQGTSRPKNGRKPLQVPRAKRGLERIDTVTRRKQVSDSLKELEQRGKSKKLSLEIKIAQAGLEWSRTTYIIISVVLAGIFGLGVYAVNGSPLIAGGRGAGRRLRCPVLASKFSQEAAAGEFRE